MKVVPMKKQTPLRNSLLPAVVVVGVVLVVVGALKSISSVKLAGKKYQYLKCTIFYLFDRRWVDNDGDDDDDVDDEEDEEETEV